MISVINTLTFKIIFCCIVFTVYLSHLFESFSFRTQKKYPAESHVLISWSQSSADYQNHHSDEKHFSSLAQNLRSLGVVAIFIHWPKLVQISTPASWRCRDKYWDDDYEFMRSSVNVHKQINKPRATPVFPGYQIVEAARMSGLK